MVIWAVATLAVLGWPPAQGHSLGVTLVRWAVDPFGNLPTLPAPLPMSMDDDGDAVTAYDQQVQAYEHARLRSTTTRWRLDLASAVDPFAPATQRQLLVGLVVAGALVVWRMSTPHRSARARD
jgi:hypothetical protein